MDTEELFLLQCCACPVSKGSAFSWELPLLQRGILGHCRVSSSIAPGIGKFCFWLYSVSEKGFSATPVVPLKQHQAPLLTRHCTEPALPWLFWGQCNSCATSDSPAGQMSLLRLSLRGVGQYLAQEGHQSPTGTWEETEWAKWWAAFLRALPSHHKWASDWKDGAKAEALVYRHIPDHSTLKKRVLHPWAYTSATDLGVRNITGVRTSQLHEAFTANLRLQQFQVSITAPLLCAFHNRNEACSLRLGKTVLEKIK